MQKNTTTVRVNGVLVPLASFKGPTPLEEHEAYERLRERKRAKCSKMVCGVSRVVGTPRHAKHHGLRVGGVCIK